MDFVLAQTFSASRMSEYGIFQNFTFLKTNCSFSNWKNTNKNLCSKMSLKSESSHSSLTIFSYLKVGKEMSSFGKLFSFRRTVLTIISAFSNSSIYFGTGNPSFCNGIYSK